MATSINIPALNHAIRADIPAINEVIKALAKNDPSVLTDYESGTKRIVEESTGWEIQQYNGTSWVLLSDFNINAQKVDGHSASTGTTVNTIPVRNKDGKLPGDILGNAATATSAKALSVVNPIDMGGTGGTTPSEARTNLDVPPTSHASSGTGYGTGTGSNYGHVKLSDSTSSTSAASAGIAASPKAVKAAYDRASTAITNADAAQTAADAAQTAADAAQTAADAAQSTADGKAPKAHASSSTTYGIGTGSNYGHVKLSDSTSSTSAASEGIAASPKAVKDAYDKAAAAYLPVGAVIAYASNSSVHPAGYLLCNGAAVSRTTYASLYNKLGTTYGAGDGSSTFNIPNLTDRFIQGSGTAGKAKAAGLPNITGGYTDARAYPYADVTGAFTGTYTMTFGGAYAVGGTGGHIVFDASNSNAIYGSAETVQPPAVTMRYYIKY